MGDDGYNQFIGKIAQVLRCNNRCCRILMAEFLGTFFLVVLSDGAVAQWVLSGKDIKISSFLTVNFAYAFAIAFGVYISGGVSGGHINPAVTLCMCIFGRCEYAKLLVYWVSQFVGAFVGAAASLYYPAFKHFETTVGNETQRDKSRWAFETAGIFGTFPAEHLDEYIFAQYYDQFVGTVILLICVFAISDSKNMAVSKHLVPLLIGLTVGEIGMSYGWNCGFAINPARDLGPRFLSFVVGWGPETFS